MCVCLLFVAGSGVPASRARCGAPHLFLWPLCLSALLGPLRAGVAPLSLAALADPRCLGAVLWLFFSASCCLVLRALAPRLCLHLGRWLLFGGFSPPPSLFVSRGFRRSLLGWGLCFFYFFFFIFFFPFFPWAPPLFTYFSGFRPRVPWASALCVVCFVGLPPLGSPCACSSFVLSAWLVVAPWWLLPPPPPFLSRGFRRCRSVLCAVLCRASLGPVLRRAAARCVLRCCAVLCCVVLVGCRCLLRRALWRCPLPWGPVLCGAAFCGFPPCCVCFVVARWCVLLFAALLCAVCVPGCCGVRSLSSPLCAVLCFAVLVRSRCAVRVVRALAGAWCCGVPWCGAGSGGPWLWRVSVSVSLCGRVVCFPVVGVVCCGVLLSCVVFCGAVLSRGAVLLCSAVVLRCCWGLLCPPVGCRAVLCCAVGWLCCFLPSGGVCVLWCSFPRAVCSLSSLLCALWCLVALAAVPCFPVSCAVALCCRVVLCCRALLSFCGAVCVCFALLRPVVRRQCRLCCCWCLVLWRVPVRCGVSLGVLRCGGAPLVCRGVLLCCALSCGVLRPVPCPAVPCCPAVLCWLAVLCGCLRCWCLFFLLSSFPLYLLEKPLQNFVKSFFFLFFFFLLLKIK